MYQVDTQLLASLARAKRGSQPLPEVAAEKQATAAALAAPTAAAVARRLRSDARVEPAMANAPASMVEATYAQLASYE